MKDVNFNILTDKTIDSIDGLSVGSDIAYFNCTDGTRYRMFHYQDCCESVSIEDINGDINDLLNTPITLAEEVSDDDFEKQYNDQFNIKDKYGYMVDAEGNSAPESHTWTFYRLATIKGYVIIRWFGESNGYYSESVDFVED